MNEGLAIKKYITKEDVSEILVVKENVTFNINDNDRYTNMFNELLEDGVFEEGSFEDLVWTMDTITGFKYLRFSFEIHPEINLALKHYILLKLHGRQNSPSNAERSLKAVTKFLLDSNFASIEMFDDYKIRLSEYNQGNKINLNYVFEFLNYYEFEFSELFIDEILLNKVPRYQNRDLPGFQSILMFDHIMLDFYHNEKSLEKLVNYYPLVLWWKITRVLPMRPIEFAILKYDSCVYNAELDKYELNIERRKKSRGKVLLEKVKQLNTFTVTKEVYELIERYKLLTDDRNTSKKYLFPYEEYKYFYPVQATKHSDHMIPRHFRVILRNFYERVILQEYGFSKIDKDSYELNGNEIHNIQLGDTRHLAITSMMLQGFNPYTIAQMAGHTTLREQFSYFGHMESYIEANTYVLAKSLAKKLSVEPADFKGRDGFKHGLIKRAKYSDEEYYSFREVIGGRCKSKTFPEECISDECIYCTENFIPDSTLTPKLLTTQLKRLDAEIEYKLDCIKNIYTNMLIESEGIHDKDHQSMLKQESFALNELVNQRTIIHAYEFSLGEVN